MAETPLQGLDSKNCPHHFENDPKKQYAESTHDGHQEQQPDHWRVASRFTPFEEGTVQNVYLMHAAPGDEAWMSNFDKILLTDYHGNIQQKSSESVKNFCVSPKDNSIWYYNYSKAIRRVQHQDFSDKFKAQNTPTCICLSEDDHVVIGHKQYLAKYTTTGQIICKTATPLFKPPVVRKPVRITECPVTKNLAVIDQDGRDYGKRHSYHVTILDKDLQLLCIYHPSKDFGGGGMPMDLCYTRAGQLVVADYISKSVKLVSEKGQYIETLYSDSTTYPRAVCVQSDGTIFVSFTDNSVRVLKQK